MAAFIKSEFHFSFVCKDIFVESVKTDKISDEYLVFRVQRGAWWSKTGLDDLVELHRRAGKEKSWSSNSVSDTV